MVLLPFPQEKGFRDYGHDMDNTDTLLECGLGFTCDFGKAREFVGQSHLVEQKQRAQLEGGLRKRMVNVLLDDPDPLIHHGEVLWRDGQPMSYIRAGSYGHTLGGAVGLAMLQSPDEAVTKSFLQQGDWQVEIGPRKYPCRVSLAPFYDPKNLRVKDPKIGLRSSTLPEDAGRSTLPKSAGRSFSTRAAVMTRDNMGDVTGDIPEGGVGIQSGQFAESRRSFSQQDVDAFAVVARDFNPLHQPSHYGPASEHPLALNKSEQGKVVVHGMLVATLFTHIFGTLIPGSVYRKQSLLFRKAVHVDEEVVGRIRVLNVRTRGNITLVQCETNVEVVKGCAQHLCVQGEAEVVLPFGSMFERGAT
jgi:acyl dehydratase